MSLLQGCEGIHGWDRRRAFGIRAQVREPGATATSNDGPDLRGSEQGENTGRHGGAGSEGVRTRSALGISLVIAVVAVVFVMMRSWLVGGGRRGGDGDVDALPSRYMGPSPAAWDGGVVVNPTPSCCTLGGIKVIR